MFKSLKINDNVFLNKLIEKKDELIYIMGVGDLNIDVENQTFSYHYINREAELNFISKLSEIGIPISSN